MTSPAFTNLDDLIRPQIIQGFVRKLIYPVYELQDYFPNLAIQGSTYRFDKTQLLQEPAVQYRALDTETPIGDRQGVVRGTAELPVLGKKKLLTEEQSLKLRALETGDYSAYVQQIYNDLDNLTQGVHGRWEIDRGILLGTGALTVTSTNGWSVSVDYGVPSGNKVTANTLWSDLANADPLGDLTTWQLAYQNQNRGLNPGQMLIGQTVRNNILRNNSLRAAMYYGSPNSGPPILNESIVQEFLTAHGLPTFRTILSQATDENGTTGTVFPQNKVVLLPDPSIPIGYTATGVTASALDMVEQGTLALSEAPGIVGLTWNENDPPHRFNMIDAMGMPVLANPNLLFIATVG